MVVGEEGAEGIWEWVCQVVIVGVCVGMWWCVGGVGVDDRHDDHF